MLLLRYKTEQQSQNWRVEYNNSQQREKRVPENEVSVAVVGDKGFWVDNNRFYVAEIYDGEIDPRDATEIDAFGVPNHQLGYLFKILDKINGE